MARWVVVALPVLLLALLLVVVDGFQMYHHHAAAPRAASMRRSTPLLSASPDAGSTTAVSSPTAAVPPRPLSPPPPLMEGDVVEFIITAQQRAKGQLPPGDGRVLGLGVVTGLGLIQPLCQRKADDPLLFWDEDQDAIEEAPASIVTRVLTQVGYSQRCIEDRKINPHGEEAEDVFEIEEALTPGCGPAIRF